MKAFLILCGLAAMTSASEDRGKRSYYGLGSNNGYNGYGNAPVLSSSYSSKSYGSSYGYGSSSSSYGSARRSSYSSGQGYYSYSEPGYVPYNSYSSHSVNYNSPQPNYYPGAYTPQAYTPHSNSYTSTPSYSAPGQVVDVRNEVVPSTGYNGYGTGVSNGYGANDYSTRGYSGHAYAGAYPGQYSASGNSGSTGGNNRWW